MELHQAGLKDSHGAVKVPPPALGAVLAQSGFLGNRNWKHLQLFLSFSKGAVREVLVMFAATLSSKLVLDSAAGESEVVSGSGGFFFLLFFQRESSVVGLKRKNEWL